MELEVLGPLGLCLHCGASRRALDPSAPTCCADPAVLTVWTVRHEPAKEPAA